MTKYICIFTKIPFPLSEPFFMKPCDWSHDDLNLVCKFTTVASVQSTNIILTLKIVRGLVGDTSGFVND